MNTDEKNNTITFEDDNEFYDWAVSPFDVFERSESGTLMSTWNFTSSYEKAVERGTKLIINDPKSSVVKHQAVTFRTVTRPVEVSGRQYSRPVKLA